MHEMSIAQSLLEILVEECKKHQVGKVLSVSLKVGELSAVECESLRYCFGLITEGTVAQGARLEIERVPVRCRCRQCGCDFTVEQLTFICPGCRGRQLDLLDGRELSLESFEAG